MVPQYQLESGKGIIYEYKVSHLVKEKAYTQAHLHMESNKPLEQDLEQVTVKFMIKMFHKYYEQSDFHAINSTWLDVETAFY